MFVKQYHTHQLEAVFGLRMTLSLKNKNLVDGAEVLNVKKMGINPERLNKDTDSGCLNTALTREARFTGHWGRKPLPVQAHPPPLFTLQPRGNWPVTMATEETMRWLGQALQIFVT